MHDGKKSHITLDNPLALCLYFRSQIAQVERR